MEIKEALDILRDMRDKPLFTVSQDGDIRTLGKRGVSLPWNIFDAMRTVCREALDGIRDDDNAEVRGVGGFFREE